MKKISGLALLGLLLLVGCGELEASDDLGAPAVAAVTALTAEPGANSSGIEWYFCVDHPCPDLDPRKYSECFRPNSGSRMVVAVDNVGTRSAGASKAKFWVDYYGYSATYEVPSLPAGNHFDLWITMPSACLTPPGCSWGVLADATKIVSEINGNNNTVRGACIY